MIEIDDKARAAITNARALLDTMLSGGWEEVCVQSEDGDYFLARLPGTSNPLVAPAPVAAAPVAPAAPQAAAAASGATVVVTAPHVGTVNWLAPVGAAIGQGEAVARLAVLDQVVDVAASAAGVIVSHIAKPGEFAEFATDLVTLQA